MRAGLEALGARAPDIVLVHDAARPFCSAALVARAIAAAPTTGAAVPALAVTDTIKRVDADGRVDRHARSRARCARCRRRRPSRFRRCSRRIAAPPRTGREDFTDDAALAEWAGLKVAVFAGEAGNVKLTTDEDFARAEARRIASLADVRTGTGFDVHAFGDGDHVMLGGVRIPHDRGLTGHSDADVALHALVDAILGALADGDIGEHFPPSDPRWRGASSDQFLEFAVERVTQARRPHRASRRHHRLRGAAHRAASRRHARSASPRSPASRSSASRSRRRPASSSASPAAAKASPRMATATVRLPWSAVMIGPRHRRPRRRALLDLCKAQAS